MADTHSTTSKKCSKCGDDKPLSEFSKKKNTRDGLRPNCRVCASAEYKAWAAINKPAKPGPITRWYAEDGDLVAKLCGNCGLSLPPSEFHRNAGRIDELAPHCKACAKKRAGEWYSDNREYGRAYRREWHQKNRETLLPKMRARWAKNRSAMLARAKIYRDSHKEEKRARDKAWQEANPDRVRVHKRISQAKRRAQVRGSTEHHTSGDVDRLYKNQRGKCACCRKPIAKGYHVDHVIALSKGGGNGPLNIQLLCPTCNIRKNAKDPIDFMQENGFLI